MSRALVWGGVLSLALHVAAGVVLLRPPAPPPLVLAEGVEIMPEPPAPQPEAAEPEPVAEAAAPPPPPEAVISPPPDTVATVEPPPPEQPPPPEPVVVAAPPEPPLPTPPEEVVAALPEPPQPAPSPPPRPVARVAAAPRPAPRAATTATDAAPTAPAAASVAAVASPLARPAPPPTNLPQTYLGALHAALQRHQRYPDGARWRRSEGTPMVQFRLRRDGAVLEARLLRSSGDPELDAAALATIQRAAPLPPMPPDYPAPERDFTIPLRFSLR